MTQRFPRFARLMETEHGQILLHRDVDEKNREGVATLIISAFAGDVARMDMKLTGLAETSVMDIIENASEERLSTFLAKHVEQLVGAADAMDGDE